MKPEGEVGVGEQRCKGFAVRTYLPLVGPGPDRKAGGKPTQKPTQKPSYIKENQRTVGGGVPPPVGRPRRLYGVWAVFGHSQLKKGGPAAVRSLPPSGSFFDWNIL